MSAEQEPVDVVLTRLQSEVEHLREHLTYVSKTVRRMVEIIIREDDDSSVNYREKRAATARWPHPIFFFYVIYIFCLYSGGKK